MVEESYLAGVIQDIGILALASNWPARWRQVDRSEMELSEQTIFGTTHAAFGAYIASLWGLPDSLVEAIRYHSSPERAPISDGFNSLVALLAARTMVSNGFDPVRIRAESAYLGAVGLQGELQGWIDAVEEMRNAA